MFKSNALRQVVRTASTRPASLTATRPAVQRLTPLHIRPLTTSFARRDPSEQEYDAATTSGKPGESGDHEGQFARTDEGMRIEHPEEEHYPKSQPVQGRGGTHNMRTLASFSLEGKSAIVTGGARGLGLVMAQALVISGADVAIVDMSSKDSRVFSANCKTNS